jgi:hypothetical protein
MRRAVSVLIVAVGLLGMGCASSSVQRGATLGAVAGAAAGAGVAVLITEPDLLGPEPGKPGSLTIPHEAGIGAVVIGAVVGGIVGAMAGHHAENPYEQPPKPAAPPVASAEQARPLHLRGL